MNNKLQTISTIRPLNKFTLVIVKCPSHFISKYAHACLRLNAKISYKSIFVKPKPGNLYFYMALLIYVICKQTYSHLSSQFNRRRYTLHCLNIRHTEYETSPNQAPPTHQNMRYNQWSEGLRAQPIHNMLFRKLLVTNFVL